MYRSVLIVVFLCFNVQFNGQVFISEFFTATNSNEELRKEKYVEIHNPTDCSIDLTGWNFFIITNCVSNLPTPLDGVIIQANSTIRLSASDATLFNDHEIIDFEYSNSPSNMNHNWNGQYRDGAFIQNPLGLIEDIVLPNNYGNCGSNSLYYQNYRLIKKSNFCLPSSTPVFSPTEWDLIPVSTISDLPIFPEHMNSCMLTSGTANWIGGTSTNWHDCTNWSNLSVPNQFIDVVIDDNSLNNCEVFEATAFCKSLTMTKSSGSNIRMLRMRNDQELIIEEDFECSVSGGTGDNLVRFQNGHMTVNGDYICHLNSPFTQSNIDMEFMANTDNSLICQNIELINLTSDIFTINSIVFNISLNSGEIICDNILIEGNGPIKSAILNTDPGSSSTSITVNQDVVLNNYGSLDAQSGLIRIGEDLLNNSGFVNPLFGFGNTSVFEFFGNKVIQEIHSQNPVPFNILINNNPNTNSGIRLFEDISVSNTLVLTNDYIDLNGNRLTIESSLPYAISGSGGIISESVDFSGVLSWNVGNNTSLYSFPFSAGFGQLVIPFEFQLTQGSTEYVDAATYGTSFDNQPLPNSVSNMINLDLGANGSTVADRWWNIEAPDLGNLEADLSFSYLDAEHTIGCEGCTNAKRHDGTNWEAFYIDLSPSYFDIPGVSRKLSIENVNQFSTWGIVGQDTPLPIELIDFKAVKNENVADLTWTTLTEVNSKEIIIERAGSNGNFSEIGQVEAAHQSYTAIDYYFTDYVPLSGVNYYRLKLVDFDGSYEFSEVKSVNFESCGFIFRIENGYEINCDEKMEYALFGASGRLIEKGVQTTIRLQDLAKGIYFLHLGEKETYKLLF